LRKFLFKYKQEEKACEKDYGFIDAWLKKKKEKV